MACGAPVLAGNNSAMPEVVGSAGLLVDAHDPAAIMRGVEHVLSDPRRRELLAIAGRNRVRGLTWECAARVALDAIDRLPPPRPEARATRHLRPAAADRKVITMCHFQRPEYSRQMLAALRECFGVEDYLILPHVEPGNDEVLRPGRGDRLRGVPSDVQPDAARGEPQHERLPGGRVRARRVRHPPGRRHRLRPDALRYFEWCRARYAADESVFTVSAYHRLAEHAPVAVRRRVHRRRSFTPWGWATWRNRADQFLGAFRPLKYPWDVFLNVAFPASGIPQFRLEVHPALSRCQNIGLVSSVAFNDPGWFESQVRVPHWAGNHPIPAGEYHE